MSDALEDRPLRVVVCGTTFGQVYLQGLGAGCPELELVGILGHGSERTRRCGGLYGVPVYTDPAELPDEVDAACVVVRAGLLGGAGAELAQTLMGRGIHVLQEHPLHHDELAACLRVARQAGVVYALNSFYPQVEPVRRFLAATRELIDGDRPVYVDASCGFQLAFSLLDILGRALGRVRPWSLIPAVGGSARAPFRSLDGEVGGVPATLRIQNEMDPGDPDNHAHLDHRITIGTDGGNLTLLSTHGPIVLSQRPRYPHAPRDPGSLPHFDGHEVAEPPSATVLGAPAAPGYAEIFRALWPPAVRGALLELREAIITGEGWRQRGQHHLSVCLLWQDIAARLGPPELIRRATPAPLSADRLAAIVHAGGELEPAGRGA
ncbi:MAG TPA: Gfo/Idh/MocA family oxidoreductase [Solirubrobacteraceae bacterium]|nr:Gfo/Idh/MocA family oxidoreductase [Solirubrobacteraceae bacterium]